MGYTCIKRCYNQSKITYNSITCNCNISTNIKNNNIENKNNLEAFVERCSKLDQSKYSEESWAAYYPVYEASVEMLKVPHSQAEVDEQYVKLVTAYLGLRLIPDSGLIDK